MSEHESGGRVEGAHRAGRDEMTSRNAKRHVFVGLLLSASIFAISCNDDSAADEEGEELGRRTGARCPNGSTPTYDNFAKSFLSTYCVTCHSAKVTDAARKGAPADHNFDKLADVELFADHIDQMAGSGPDAMNLTMPPSDPRPSTEERVRLSQWVACGTP